LLDLIAFRFPVDDGGRRVAELGRLIENDLWRHRFGDVVRTISDRTRIHQELQ
jgi:hypothetical protein